MRPSTTRRSLVGLTALLAVTALSAQTPLKTVKVATGLTRPLFAGSPPGDFDRLFIVEENTGLIKILKNGAILPTPFLNIFSKITTSGELGLLGLAFHPDYANNGYFYVNYTAATPLRTVIERYTVSANPDVADPASAFQILSFPQTASNHNAGWLGFGPNDGYLYIATGDGGSGNDPNCQAQNLGLLLGKILRIDVDSASPYAIPPTNPLVGVPSVREEIWSWGLRNPFRCSFDRATGDFFIGDVGQSFPTGREEVSFEPAGSPGGRNYGWKLMQGFDCYLTTACVNPIPCPDPAFTLPIHTFNTGSNGNCSVIGGYVYRGCAIPDLVGTYFFADHCALKVWSLEYDGSVVSNFKDRTEELTAGVGAFGRITSFGEDACGELYITDLAGDVRKIVANVPSPGTNLGFGKVGSNGQEPLFELCGLLDGSNTAEAILRRAPASSPAAVLLGGAASPVMFWFGTIVPASPIAVPFFTGADGRAQFTVPGGLPAGATLVGQWAVIDAGLPGQLGLSNGLMIVWP